jgi:hypothetical protein
VLKRIFVATVVSVACTGIAVGAQSSTDPQQNPTQAQPTSGMDQPGTTTLTGCVYRESDVPGRTPNVAEKAGVLEDYILADAKASAASGATGTSGSTSASGAAGATAKMYKLERIADDRLSSVVGKRVEVTGRIDAEAGDQATGTSGAPSGADKSAGPDRIELPEFEVSSIREIEGTCPPKPESK